VTAAASDEPVVVMFPTEKQVLITRDFDAPRNLVYRAWTTPELVRLWWSGERGEVTTTDIDLRVGGCWRYVLVALDGTEVAFRGQYREIVDGHRLVYTEMLESAPDAEALTTVTFAELDAGRSRVQILIQYETRGERDAHRDYMGDGLIEALVLLERAALTISEPAFR
jgi:uncharacterized protein YndB with AHSA1/START domain